MSDRDGLALVEQGTDQRHGGADLTQRDRVNPHRAGQSLRVAPEALCQLLHVERILAAPAPEIDQSNGQPQMP